MSKDQRWVNPFTRVQWNRLSRETRVQWLEETDFDRHPPSQDLLHTAFSELGEDRLCLPSNIVRRR